MQLFSVLRAGVLASGLVLAPAAALASFLVEPDPHWEEDEVTMPPPPEEKSLREFFVTSASSNVFMVDEASLDVGGDGVVRYVLVVRTSGGAENVTYEGIRCNTGERRIYAHGRPDGEWAPARRSEWEPLRHGSYNMPQSILAAQHFCDGPAPPRSRAAALRGLRSGSERWRSESWR